MIKDGFFLLGANSIIQRLNSVYETTGMTGWFAPLEPHTYSDGSTVMQGSIYCGEIKYAEILLKTPNPDPNSEELLIQITPRQTYDPIICQLVVYINFYDIIQQTQNLGPNLNEDNVEDAANSMAELLKDIESIYYNVVVPVLITCDPGLTDEEIEESFATYTSNTLYSAHTIGELAVDYGNFFSLWFFHTFSISTSEEYLVENQIDMN